MGFDEVVDGEIVLAVEQPRTAPDDLVLLATVALANKNARIIWAILSKGQDYQPAEAYT
ncbi:hypothetical protein [Pseudomonas sp.]|uniref:hypothetical protein n=1 Tax=Pseudomonas sp. TaxID=306 RepID=UPI003BB49BDF